MHENLLDKIYKKLKNISKYLSEDGNILKKAVYEDCLKMDKDLIGLLLSDSNIKETFFVNVDGVLVFDKSEFASLISSEDFLPDSYTKYQNKIGLTSNRELISSSDDVVLTFPFKDCYLEGGQTNEDDKRSEILLNETIAHNEITRMLSPKVFTNAKRYTIEGVKEDIAFDENDNLIIKGNNLIAISSLLERYEGKIKCIYIDPPYNTGNDSFNYNDSFTHSSWLIFLKNRLELAKKLLREDGLIFIQSDCSRNNGKTRKGSPELGYLLVLCDEIFGRKNYIGLLHWKKKKQPSFLSKIAAITENILIYSKNENLVKKLGFSTGTDSTKKIDNATNKISTRQIQSNILCKSLSNGIIKAGTYKNKTMQTTFLNDVIIKDNRTVNSFAIQARFLNTQQEIDRFCNENLIFITNNNSLRRYKDEKEKLKVKSITDLLLDWGQNQDANSELMTLFNISTTDKIFSTPKPELLLRNILLSCTEPNDIVLDFFAGSGTTAAVAHKMKRKYISIEQMDSINNVILPRLVKVIDGEKGGISKEVNWQGGGSFVYCELMENSQELINKINLCQNTNDLLKLRDLIYSDERILPYITKNDLIKAEEEFNSATLNVQKEILIKIVDKNKLYVNLSDIENEDYNISKQDKKFTNSFYRLEEK